MTSQTLTTKDSKCNIDQTECEIDTSFNYIDIVSESLSSSSFYCECLPPKSYNSIDVAAFFIDLPTSRESIRAWDFQIHTSKQFATAHSAYLELKQLWKWIDKQITLLADELAPLICRLVSRAVAQQNFIPLRCHQFQACGRLQTVTHPGS